MSPAAPEGLTTEEIGGLAAELHPFLSGRRLRGAFGVKSCGFVLEFSGDDRRAFVLVIAQAPRPRVHLADVKPEAAPSPDARRLTDELAEAKLLAFEAVEGDRRLEARFRRLDGSERTLHLELFPRRPNWILTDGNGVVVVAGRPAPPERRGPRAGEPYEPPARVKAAASRPAESRFPGPDAALSLNRAVARHFEILDAASALDAARTALTGDLAAAARARTARIAGLRARLELAGRADELQRRADLLSAERRRVPRGAPEVRLVNYFDPSLPEVVIPLDPTAPVESQVERLYTKIRKLRAGAPRTRAEIERAEREIEILTTARAELGAMSDLDSIAALRSRLEAARFWTRRNAAPRARQVPAEPFRRFRSSDGREILVGKGARENETLTFRHARGADLWLHAGGGASGSHVIVRLERGETAPLETLLDAATLAIHFSKARGSGRADVLYTLRKYVSRIRGAAPGKVAITGETHLSLDLDRSRLDRLLSGHRPELGDAAAQRLPT